MPEQSAIRFFSQHVPLLDPLAFDDALCFDARLEPALHADLRNGPDVKATPVDRETMIRSGISPTMRGAVVGLRYDDSDVDECSFFWNEVKDFTTSMLYILPGASHLWVNAVYVLPTSPHLLQDGDIIQLHSPSQSLHTRFIYRQTPFLGCAHIPLAFDVLGKLGSGSSGVVKECRDRYTGERVAVKAIKAHEGPEVAFHDGYPREYVVLQALWKPEDVKRYCADTCVEPQELAMVRCRALWFDERRKEHYIVYPLARTDLDQIVTTNGRLSERAARSVAKQLCTALHYIHASDIVHCDVKPGNILITGPGNTPTPHDDLHVVLADFGYALWGHEIASIPRSLGTRGCKAPESATFKKCDSAIDMFALGATIFFALTGRFPYGYKDPGDIIIDARQLSVWPLLESVGVSAAGQDWLARALLLDPRERMTASEALQHAWVTGGELTHAAVAGVTACHRIQSGEYSYLYYLDPLSSEDSDDDDDSAVTCHACGARRRRAGSETGSETLEGSEQEAKVMIDVET